MRESDPLWLIFFIRKLVLLKYTYRFIYQAGSQGYKVKIAHKLPDSCFYICIKQDIRIKEYLIAHGLLPLKGV
jgi:hypothetical protein